MFRRVAPYLALLPCLILVGWVFTPDRPVRDGRVHIRYWEKWTGFEEQAMRDVVNAFNRKQDKIFVDMLSISLIDQKLLLATAGGNPPDVAGLFDFNVVVYADNDALQPLGSAVPGRPLPHGDRCSPAGFGPDYYLRSYWNLCTHRDIVWALPTTPASVALHWNRDLFREAGLDPDTPPKTIEELDRMSDRLTSRDPSGKIARMGFMQSEPDWWNWAWGNWYGGRLWDGESTATVASPENLRGYEWVQKYSKKYGSKDLQSFQSGFGNFSSPQNAFLTGQVAMVMQGVWMANFIHRNNSGLDWDAAPFPHPADRPDLANSTPVGCDVLVIPKGSKHPDAAWEFIKYVQSQEGMEMLCLGQWKHSPLTHVSEKFYKTHPNKRIKLFYDLAAGKNTFSTPRVGMWREWQDEMKAAFQKIWTSNQEPRVVLDTVQSRMQPKLTGSLERARLRFGSN